MFESEGLAFLKEHSIPDPNLKMLISLCDSVDAVFELLNTQFSDKGTDYRILIKYICGLPALKENYDSLLRNLMRLPTFWPMKKQKKTCMEKLDSRLFPDLGSS